MGKTNVDLEQRVSGFMRSGNFTAEDYYSEEIQDIVTTPPIALVRWGITWVLLILLSMIAVSAFIHYPDIVRAKVRISNIKAPKAVICRQSGRIIKLLAADGDKVVPDQVLGWIESSADHKQILDLGMVLQNIRDSVYTLGKTIPANLLEPSTLRLGELQSSYQSFYQSYLNYRAATGQGIYLKRRNYILRRLQNIVQQRGQLARQLKFREKEYALAEGGFERYKKLADRKIISPAEFQLQEAALLSKQYPIQQTQSELLANDDNLMSTEKELADLDNQIDEEKSKFLQALNSLLSNVQQWKIKYILSSPTSGNVVFAGIIQQDQYVEMGKDIFYINPGGSQFFAEANVPQRNMGKVKRGQNVLIKLDSYPFEEYGALKGTVASLSKVPYQDSIFLSRIEFQAIPLNQHFELSTGMTGKADIITEEVPLLLRLVRNMRLLVENQNEGPD